MLRLHADKGPVRWNASMAITFDDAPVVKLLLNKGMKQHDIAALYKDNQGRVSEINTGKRYASAPVADHLPPDFPPLP